jgi:hypothetical protein
MTIGYDMTPSLDHELEPRSVDEYVAIDMDRTLLDTDAVIELLCMLMTQHGATQSEMEKEIADIYSQTGTSLQLLEYLREHHPEKIDVVIEEALALAEDGAIKHLIFDGTAELFEELDKKQVPFGIMTYGNEEDQQFKLSLLRKIINRDAKSLPSIITQESYKALAITKWQKDVATEDFIIPVEFGHDTPIHTKRIIILDDKKDNLVSPENERVLGVLVDNRDPTQSLQAFVATLKETDSIGRTAHQYKDFD